MKNELKLKKNTKNSCCNCQGRGAECRNGGAWIYCKHIPEMLEFDDYDETGETDSCNLFISK